MSLQAELINIMHSVSYVQKDAKNAFHGYKYASAEAVLGKVNDALHCFGVAIVASAVDIVSFVDGLAVVRISWTLAKGEERATFQGIGSGSDKGDKAIMKASTAALKYLLSNAFCISWGDDPEADADTDRRAEGGVRVSLPSSGLPSPASLFSAISSAAINDTLKAIKGAILEYRGADPDVYKSLVGAYKAREKELNNGTSEV